MARRSANKKKENFIDALNLLEEEKGIQKDTVIEELKEVLEKSYKKNYLKDRPEAKVTVEINEDNGEIKLYETEYVVDDDKEDFEDYEISEEYANSEEYALLNGKHEGKYKVGDVIVREINASDFGRLAASQTKQLLRQKVREAEKETLYNEYADKKDDIITGIVDRVEDRFAIINIGRTGALLSKNDQIPGETIFEGQHLKVYVSDVEKTPKGTHIGVSRTDPGLIKRLFESEVPEIYDGTVEIRSVAREAGERSKIAVSTDKDDIDPVGSCVGPKGIRVRNVVNELNHEMIDIIEWNENPITYISNALSPAKVVKVKPDLENNSAVVIVPDNQLSLAIGKKGQNARLAVRLTGWKIDIKSVSEADAEGISITEDDDFDLEFYKAMMDKADEEVVDDSADFILDETDEFGEVFDEYSDVEQETVEEEPEQEEKKVQKSQPKAREKVELPDEMKEKLRAVNEGSINEDESFIKYDTEEYNEYEDEFEDEEFDDEYDYEYEDDHDSKYDEDIDYDQYDEYYDD